RGRKSCCWNKPRTTWPMSRRHCVSSIWAFSVDGCRRRAGRRWVEGGAQGTECCLVVGLALCGFGEGDKLGQFLVVEVAIDEQQAVAQVAVDLRNQLLPR